MEKLCNDIDFEAMSASFIVKMGSGSRVYLKKKRGL